MSPVRDATQRTAHALGLQTAHTLETRRSFRVVWLWMAGIFTAVVVVLLLPWQQNVQGSGTVIAFSPQDRAQTLPARIDGRIERFLVDEGAFVRAGTPVVEISEVKDDYLDPALLERTSEQLDAKRQSNRDKVQKAAALERLLQTLQDALVAKREQARTYMSQSRALLEQAILEDSLARDQHTRRAQLYASPLGLVSLNDLQATRLRAQSAAAKRVEKSGDLRNAELALTVLDAEYGEKIEKARSDRQSVLAEISEGVGEISKLENKLATLTARKGAQQIEAPLDGYVVRAVKNGIGEMVKAGDAVVTIQPANGKRAVELYVRAMDVPLLRINNRVRVQFDGWPALQFSGWPSVSVGTFGGIVAVIDQNVSADGRFRVLVVADSTDEPWPAELRLGSGAYGWTALQNVRVWFELWRQLNGFPPSVPSSGASATAGDKPAATKEPSASAKK
ncbi:MAG: HlyD family efflux transporter periplasmic adaptor subunit [Gemmatimonadaceae bacterium]